MRKFIFSVINTLFLGGDPVVSKLFTMLGHKSEAVSANEDYNLHTEKATNAFHKREGFVNAYKLLRTEIQEDLDNVF